MEIILFIDDFLYELFPDIKKGNEASIKEILTKFYSIGAYQPTIIIESEMIRIQVDLQNFERVDKEFKKVISLCEKGNFSEAKITLLKILEINPTNGEFHRILGQIESEEGNQEIAIDSLLEALRWDPKNAFALIMMGNIFLKFKDDFKTAMKYYEKALQINPKDYLTINNIGATLAQLKKLDEAEIYFHKAHEINPEFPNTHYGFGLVAEEKGDFFRAFNAYLNSIKVNPKKDELYKLTYRKIFEVAEHIVANESIDEILREYTDELTKFSDSEIRIEASKEIPYVAKIEYGELYNRNFHLIKYLPDRPAVSHLIMHELCHLKYAVEARNVGKYRLITSDMENKNSFKIQMNSFVNELVKYGMKNAEVENLINSIFDGLVSQIFNTPIDLFIEDYLYNRFEKLRPFQFISLYKMMQEYIVAATDSKISKFIPQSIVSKNRILNLVSAMQFAELFSVDFINDFNPNSSELKIANSFFDNFKSSKENKEPAIEYDLISKWSKRLEIDYMFSLSEESEIRKIQHIESTNIDVEDEDLEMARFLQSQEIIGTNMAVIAHMIGALHFFKKMTNEEVKKIALEIAVVGMSGISPDKSGYGISSIPGKEFSGYELLSYYYISWSIAFPEALDKLQLPFKDEYSAAIKFIGER